MPFSNINKNFYKIISDKIEVNKLLKDFMIWFKQILQEILYVSRITNVNRKKIRIIFSVLLANINVGIDILIIIIFSNFFTQNITHNKEFIFYIVDTINNNLILLPILVLLRYLFVYIEKLNIQSLQVLVNENLRYYFIEEIYKRGNYSTSDAYFYLNTITTHVSYFYGALSGLLNNGLQVVGYTLFLLIVNPNIVIYFFIGSFIIAFPTRKLLLLGRKFMHKSYEVNKNLSDLTQRILDNLFLIKILKTTKEELNNYRKNLDLNYDAQISNKKYGIINNLIPNFVTIFSLTLIFTFTNLGVNLTLEFVAVLIRLFQTLGVLNGSLNMVVNSHVHIQELKKIDDNKIIKNNLYFVEHKLEKNIAVKFTDLEFCYFNNNKSIFENLNLVIYRGKHTVLTGPNGSGKSTILGLCSGILNPKKGKIETFSNSFGYVGVTPLILRGTLKENLVYGNSRKIFDDEILNLVEEFKLFEQIDNSILDLKVDNKSLSSGQMQKISFIRALLNKSEILLLDESTSNLDIVTRLMIFEILNKKNLTIINSTHNKEDFDYQSEIKISIENNIRKLHIS